MRQENPNVRIMCFDDLEMLRGAVASIPSSWTIYVCDGRYISFEDDKDWTPAIRDWCKNIKNVRYCKPPDERLPFGVDRDWPDDLRPGVTAKGEWMLYEVLPQDEWVLKIDTDERLKEFDININDLDPYSKYCPEINMVGEEHRFPFIERLYVPQNWSVWVDDCLLPREEFPRDSDPSYLREMHRDKYGSRIRKRFIDSIKIDNIGAQRDSEYQEKRHEQLKKIGRGDRAQEVSEMLKERHGDS